MSFLGENGGKVNKKGILCVFLATIFISINNVLSIDAITAGYFLHLTIPFFTSVMFMSFGAIIGALLLV